MTVAPEILDSYAAIQHETTLEVQGGLEAIEELRRHLSALERMLGGGEYEQASILGYQEIAVSFVHLQRCLGGVQALAVDEQLLVQVVAREEECSEGYARTFLRSQRQVAEQRHDQQREHNE